MASKEISEKLLQWVWQNQLLADNFLTECGTKVKVLSPGTLNFEDGPDFRNAKIKLNNNILEGDIEVHLLSSDWFTHKHQIDPKYNNVLLHIVWFLDSRDAITQEMKSIPTLVISKYMTKSFSILLKDYKKSKRAVCCPYVKHNVMAIIEDEGIERFNDKKQRFSELIKLYGIEQATYIGIMESMGYVKNEVPFVKLAMLVPIDKLRSLIVGLKPRSKRIKLIKTVLLGVAELISGEYKSLWNKIKGEFVGMKEEEWQFFKVRPCAFPNLRIEKISYFLADTVEQGIWNFFVGAIHELPLLENRLTQTGISKSCARIIILNVYLPILAIYDETAVQIYRRYKKLPENNITKLMSETLFQNRKKFMEVKPFGLEPSRAKPKNEIYYQGMLRIYYRHCRNKQCDSCPIKQKAL